MVVSKRIRSRGNQGDTNMDFTQPYMCFIEMLYTKTNGPTRHRIDYPELANAGRVVDEQRARQESCHRGKFLNSKISLPQI